MNTTTSRTVSGRTILTIIWGILSVLLLGITVGVEAMDGPAYWVLLAFGCLQFLFLFIAVGYSTGRDDQYLDLVKKKWSW